MISNPLSVGQFARGSLCALIGLTVIATYYLYAWRKLRSGPEPLDLPQGTESAISQPRSELRHLQVGTILSVMFFMAAGAADVGKDMLYWLVGPLVGFCGALVLALFGVGFVALANLWKELVLQLRKASVGSLLVSIPAAILWLAMGLGAFLLAGMLGMLVDKLGKFSAGLGRDLLWILIALMFWRLWKGRSHAALMLRLILLISFSAVMLAAAAFAFWWIGSQTAPQFVILLTALGSLNVLFYSRFVRDSALKENLEDAPIVESRPKHLT